MFESLHLNAEYIHPSIIFEIFSKKNDEIWHKQKADSEWFFLFSVITWSGVN